MFGGLKNEKSISLPSTENIEYIIRDCDAKFELAYNELTAFDNGLVEVSVIFSLL